MNRRAALAFVGLAPIAAIAPAIRAAQGHPGAPLPVPRSLALDLGAALADRKPLVVMVSLAGCPWCAMVREHYLVPLRHAQQLPVVQVDMRSAAAVRDFAGEPRTHDQLVRAWGVKTAPTVLFFGREGREVAPRLVGASSDFYGAYLEQRLQQAMDAVRS
ncbi:hypothetical protein WG922_02900 [Ramlibacter sp. AN1015]|uniref:hypothetical protein n=1 Tax=Ramlibacter sp. AN1015 TaxID=3133428 RepID=UPI0030BAAD5F